jgi:hypothetical protein
MSSLPRRHNGPVYRRNVNHLAQEIVRAQLTPWLEGEAEFAEEEFGKISKRFVELANEFLHRLGATDVPGLEELPDDLGREESLGAQSHFYFHVMENVAAPASPLLLISDIVLGALGFRSGIVREAQEFLDQLLEVNSSRVQSDIDDRVRESRKKLENEIKRALREASNIAGRALARARAAQAAGVPGIQAALVRLESIEREVLCLISCRQPST